MKEDARKALKNGERPVEIEISDKDYPSYMGKNPKEVYFTIKMRALFTAEERPRGRIAQRLSRDW